VCVQRKNRKKKALHGEQYTHIQVFRPRREREREKKKARGLNPTQLHNKVEARQQNNAQNKVFYVFHSIVLPCLSLSQKKKEGEKP